jgi:signal transduction histidine kinase
MRSLRPRGLVARFALGSLVAFAAIGAALSVAVARQFRDRGEQQARAHASFVTQAILRYRISESDIERPLLPEGETADRYDSLASFVETRILRPAAGSSQFHVMRIKIWSRDGVVLFSDDPRLPGKRFEVEDDLTNAFRGEVQSGVTNLQADENVYERSLAPRLFETYVPLWLGPSRAGTPDAVVELYQDYDAIQKEITSGFRTVALTLLIGLAALYVVLLPIAFRTSRTLGSQNTRLEEQARRLELLLQKEQHTVAELRELNRLKTNFVAVASHELRTPLTSIIGYAKTLRQPQFAGDEGTRDEFLEAIERQGDRLFHLVENLLTTSHLEDSQLRLSISGFSFAELAREVVEGLGTRGARVRVVLPPDLPSVLSDRQYVAQIVQNLLGNALKFSPPDRDCELGARWVLGSLVFWVRDHGIGIPPDEAGKIFERFYQVDSSSTRRYGGIGLGLSLVKNLVQVLGGTIELDSQPNQGSTFTVTLPLVHPSVGKRYGHDGAAVQAGPETQERPVAAQA